MTSKSRFAGSRLAGAALLALALIAGGGNAWLADAERARTYTVDFQRGATPPDAAHGIAEATAAKLASNPDMAAVVVGHTGTLGDPEANRKLAQARAATIAEMIVDQGIATGRVETYAAGGAEPLARGEDESERAYQRRLARVEVRLTVPLP